MRSNTLLRSNRKAHCPAASALPVQGARSISAASRAHRQRLRMKTRSHGDRSWFPPQSGLRGFYAGTPPATTNFRSPASRLRTRQPPLRHPRPPKGSFKANGGVVWLAPPLTVPFRSKLLLIGRRTSESRSSCIDLPARERRFSCRLLNRQSISFEECPSPMFAATQLLRSRQQ